MIVKTKIQNGFYKLTSDSGKLTDTRTGRKFSVAIVKEENVSYFKE